MAVERIPYETKQLEKKKQAEATQFLRNPRNISENAQIMLIDK